MLALLLQGSSFLKMFVDSCDEEGCEDTALNWVIAVIVIAIDSGFVTGVVSAIESGFLRFLFTIFSITKTLKD